VELHSKYEQAYRLVPRHDAQVNGHWMCDEGRYTYKELEPEDRVLYAEIDGQPVPLYDAVALTAERLQGKKVAVVFASTATTESNQALAELCELVGGEPFILGRPPGDGDDILRDPDKNPNTRGAVLAAGDVSKHENELALELAGRAYEAVIFLDDEGELSDVVLQGLSGLTSVCLADRRTPLADACRILLPAASWAEILGTYINRQGKLRVVEPAWAPEGDRKHRADLIADLLRQLGRKNVATGRERTRLLAEQHGHTQLLELLKEPEKMRPTLLRWAHTRG
jgi:NADH-quinone oxidoreductase subunit G